MRWVLLLAFWLVPATAEACSMCAFSQVERQAYLYPTLLLMVVPLVMLGGFVFWLWRASQNDARPGVDSSFIRPT